MLATAQAIVPLQFVKVMLMFFLERMVVEECGSELFCNPSYGFPVGWAKVGSKVRPHCRKRMVSMTKEKAPMTSG